MDPATKEQLLSRFRAYLDEPLPQPPAGTSEAPDLFTLLAEVSALKNEVKLESRQVKTALEQFRELFDTLQRANNRLGEELNRQREGETSTRREAERDLLLELLDLRDRLSAGHEQAGRYRPRWPARRGKAATFIAAMADGLGMNLDRLDHILARRGVRPLESVNRPFDPQTMHAAEIAHREDQADGRVIGEIRAGFLQHERLLRPAEVIVNKRGNQK
jgi:molecular chaperone GrpE